VNQAYSHGHSVLLEMLHAAFVISHQKSQNYVNYYLIILNIHCCRTFWLREVGLIDREDKRWFYHKPKCETAGHNFVSVGIQEFYPALVILAYGIIGSIGILITEILFFKRQQVGCCALGYTTNVRVTHSSGN
jgi:hypothetical protein